MSRAFPFAPPHVRESAGGASRGFVASRVVVRRVLEASAILLLLSIPAMAAPCAAVAGSTVILKSEEIDPDVFVWDSKQRVIDYAAGSWRDTRDVLEHSLLAKPGTRALVVQCDPGVVKPKYVADPLDAVGIRLTSGPNKGRYGWVTSQDLRAIQRSR
jgi:hypothetical protein